MMIDIERIKALSVLGYNFGLHLLRSVIPRKKEDQAEKFKGYFQKDWINAFTREEIELIYNFENCTVCGLCPETCLPSALSNSKFLGPEHLITCAGRSQPEYFADIDDFFRCTLCARCEQTCPEEVKISELALLMRRWIYRVNPSEFWSIFPEVKKNLEQFGNPFGKEKPVSQKMTGKSKSVLFLGCREMVKAEPSRWIELADKLKLNAELVSGVCCGGFLEEIGAENLSPGLEKLLARNPGEVITVCPHCYYQLKKKLPESIPVKFILEMIPESIEPGTGKAQRALYHDPCFLGRKMGIIDKPRALIKRLGYELIEFSQSGMLGECCGGGGGLFWYDNEMAQRISGQKISEAKKLGVNLILTECGLCKELMQKAGEADKIEVKRISELLI
jgi:Fe-S oxidoreductase